MLRLKELIWTHLAADADLITKLGSSAKIKVTQSPKDLTKPAVTFDVSTDNKTIPDVKEVHTIVFMVVAWSVISDVESAEIADILYESLENALTTTAIIHIYESDVSPIIGPYYDEDSRAWRSDITLEVIARLKN